MKWYGVLIKKFCGASVPYGDTGGTPIFNIPLIRKKKIFNIQSNEYDLETFTINFNRKKKIFNTVINEYEKEVVYVPFSKNKVKTFNVIYD